MTPLPSCVIRLYFYLPIYNIYDLLTNSSFSVSVRSLSQLDACNPFSTGSFMEIRD